MVKEPKFRCCECNKSMGFLDICTISEKTVFIPGIGERHPNKKYCESCFKKVTKPVNINSIKKERIYVEGKLKINSDNELFERLRKRRLEIARNKKLPAYFIFYDKTLKEMVSKKPSTRLEMMRINGVGPIKFEEFGNVFLDEIIKNR